ncbi:MAG: CTP synthase [Eubacteriales bacterium]|nr:CTP synthase [Eubacteriales bacterium]
MATKFIFVTGGVVSSLGKGITAASLGLLLKGRGLKVSLQKCDPYINIDPGTMSPFQHGEVFVTDDGAETDLDIGHYERFTDENSFADSNVTTGKVYWTVISKERRGDYLGGTVQVIPHIIDEIKTRIFSVASKNKPDVVITEIGGTVGDIESQPFLETIRQIKWEVGAENCMYIHVTLMPYLKKVGELKTKPTQHSVKELRTIGIEPDIIVCRTELELTDDIKRKIALFCNVSPEGVVQNLDAESLYEVPIQLRKEKLDTLVCNRLELPDTPSKLPEWEKIIEIQKNLKDKIKIAIVGKYIELHDAYLSIAESLTHAGIANNVDVEILWINAVDFEETDDISSMLCGAHGVIVPGGFGERGIEGKIRAIQYCRENKIPFLGICLGMQLAIIEFARNVLGYREANSTEHCSDTPYPFIDLMPEQKNITDMGGTMRLGSYRCNLQKGTFAYAAYKTKEISERHRHRYEFNNIYFEEITNSGMRVAGINPDHGLVEIIENADHPWFVGVQFHPEFKSRPIRSHPLFRELVAAAKKTRG